MVRVTSGQTTAWIAGLIVSLTGLSAFAQVIDRETIDRTLDEQQRAQVQTTDLLASVLDVQLRQLEENGLTEHEIYRDVQLMQRHLRHLVESDMQGVVDTLRNARQLPPDQRDEAFKDARQQIRQVVRQLTVERELLLQRLKMFELAGQVRNLIQQQTVVRTSTTSLIGRDASNDQAAQTLKTIEDQRDIQDLYQHLIDTLNDMKPRRGLNAVIAADGLRILRLLELDNHVELASRHLQSIQFEAASEQQTLIVKGLKELLKIIDWAQGTIETEHATVREIVQALIERQKPLRDQAKSWTEPQPPPAELVEQQAQLQSRIAQLQEHLVNHAKADAYRQQAEAAVFDAASNLLENKLPAAVADQGRVLGSLTALERALADDSPYVSRDQSADDLSQTVQRLSQIQTRFAEAIQKSEAAWSEPSPPDPTEFFREVTELIQPNDDPHPWPDFVRIALDEVTDAIHAKPTDAVVSPPAAADPRLAIERAKASVDRALTETRRISLAIRIGELTRSAEVLERTAAEQRSIVKDTVGLMNGGRTAILEGIQRAQELSGRQADVSIVADKVAAALHHMMPVPAAQIADEANRVRALNGPGALATAMTSPDGMRSALETAMSVAQKLAEAAQQVRTEILTSAEELTQISTAQAERLTELRTAVESAVDRLPNPDLPIQLEQARGELDRALQEQVRAQGHSKVADAMAVARAIQDALDTQEITNLALDANQSNSSEDLKVTATQAEVAEKSHAAAQSIRAALETGAADDTERAKSLLRSLDDAEQTANQAAKQVLAGDVAAAKALRIKVQSTLLAAMALAQENVAFARTRPTSNPPDPDAQAEATKAMATAQQRITSLSREAGDELTAATQATATASTSLSTNASNIADDQAKAVNELVRARERLNARIEQQRILQSTQFSQQSIDDLEMANRIDAVEPSAAAAIRREIENAQRQSGPEKSSRQAAAISSKVTLGLEQAIAELGAREQEVRHDQAIAESVTTSIKRQQMATTTIAEQAVELARLDPDSKEETPAAARRAAAHKLNDARQRFVESQRATGQAAVELSGQIEIANAPLREALELAARFSGAEQAFNAPDAARDQQDRPGDGADQAGAAGQPDTGESQAADANDSRRRDKANGEPRDGSNSRGAPAGKNPKEMGTGFVSQSPDLTAEMMAGADAVHAARQALAAQLPPSQQPDADSKAPPEYSNDTEQTDAESSESGRSSKLAKGNNAGGVNQKVKDGMIDQQPEGIEAKGQVSGESRQQDENVSSKAIKDDAWFAKLPPELRKSLRAGVGQKGPRAYEDRLKKYFQSVD